MTCLQASQVSRLAPPRTLFSSLAGWALSARNPLKRRLAGDCLLPAGQALTVRVRRAGVLRIVQGRVWVTFSHARHDLRVPAGDYFCSAGESLPLAAGNAVVIEPWAVGGESAACWRWEPAAR